MVPAPYSQILPLIAVTADNGVATSVPGGNAISLRTLTASSTLLTWQDNGSNRTGTIASAIATVVAANPQFVGLTKPGQSTFYINAGLIAGFVASGTGSSVWLKADENGGHGTPIPVTESYSALQAAYAVALASSGVSTSQTVTATGGSQVTATATTAGIIRITGGTGGIRLDGGTPGERRWVHNVTTSTINVYPAVSETIEPAGAGLPITLGAGQSVELVCDATGLWNRERNINFQSVTGSGTTQSVTPAVSEGTDIVLLTSTIGNTATTLYRCRKGHRVSVKNIGPAVGRLFPASGDAINSLGANAVYQIGVGRTVNLRCDVDGTWLSDTSQIDLLTVNSLVTTTLGGSVTVLDAAGLGVATFSSTGIIHSYGTRLSGEGAGATPGGNQSNGAPISTNRFTITSCATLGDSCVLTQIANIVVVNNAGAAASYVYCPVGHTMDGVLNGYCIIPSGGKTLIQLGSDGTSWLSTEFPRQTLKMSALLVAGAYTFNAANIGAGYASRITATSYVRDCAITTVGAGTIGVAFTQVITPGTSIAVQAKTALGADDATDVTTRIFEIVF